MIKCVIFDIDDTLYNYVAAHTEAFRALCGYVESQLGISAERFSDMHLEMFRRLGDSMGSVAACHNRLIRYQNILEDNGIPYYPHLLKMYDIYWETLLDNSVPSPGAMETLSALKELGIRLGTGTDMTARMQFRKLDRMGMLPYIDFMVSSEEACAEKPSARFFDMCVAKAQCDRSECAFVGDSRRKDADGAIRAGMHGLWYCPDGEVALSNLTAPGSAGSPVSGTGAVTGANAISGTNTDAGGAYPEGTPQLLRLTDLITWVRDY